MCCYGGVLRHAVRHTIHEDVSQLRFSRRRPLIFPHPQLRHPPPVVRSAWIEDSIRARRKLPVAEYMVDGIFVQKGTLAASFAAAATPKKLPPPSSGASGAKGGPSSGGSMSRSKGRMPSRGAAKSPPSHLAGTRPNGASKPNGAADRLSTALSDRLVASRGGEGSRSANSGVGEEELQTGLALGGAKTAFAGGGGSSKVGGKGPDVSRTPLKGGGGRDRDSSSDSARAAPLPLSTKEQRAVVGKRTEDAAVASPALHPRTSGNEGEHTPAGDIDNSDDCGKMVFKSKSGEGRDEPTLPQSKDIESGDGDGGSGGAGGGGSGVGGGGRRVSAAGGEHPPPFELPEMGAAGEEGRSTKDDPAFMKTFFRNSRLHFIGVG